MQGRSNWANRAYAMMCADGCHKMGATDHNVSWLRRAGGSISATLPKAMVDKLHLQAGDPVFAIETEDGILLTPFDPQFASAMEVSARAARKYRQALRELAK